MEKVLARCANATAVEVVFTEQEIPLNIEDV
jgi:hypothetical protein